MTIDLIAFDADDTLWHNEAHFRQARARFVQILSAYVPAEWAGTQLDRIEIENIPHYGYGFKSFGLSMIEAALELASGSVQAKDLQAIITLLHEMMSMKVELLDEIAETLTRLSTAYPLMMITKGDLFEQSDKITRSGLTGYFRYIEIVPDKTPENYRALFQKYQIDPRHVVMVGNSLRSDIQPVLALGGQAIYIPYETTWAHEHLDPAEILPGVIEIERFGQLLESIERLEVKSEGSGRYILKPDGNLLT